MPIKQTIKLYDEFIKENNVIYDPFAGWGSRLLGLKEFLKSKNCYYIANDSNKKLENGYNYLTESFFKNHKNKISVCFSDSRNKNNELNNCIDFIFTSPPFFNDEIYTKNQEIYKSKEEWKKNLLNPVFKNCYDYLKKQKYMVIDMKEEYLQETRESLCESKFKIIEERPYFVKKSHYAHKKNLKPKNQYFIVCIKE